MVERSWVILTLVIPQAILKPSAYSSCRSVVWTPIAGLPAGHHFFLEELAKFYTTDLELLY